ncbi:hypothetical protein [Streptomyces sp. NPDC006267]|uniref:hypothetical protein n=1 Tax=Streptomyces sp. NPDC006267 TaxID=3157173 RepID=UPI0033AEC90B
MYAIREMLPDDQTAAVQLWARRVTWARARGIGPIRATPLTVVSTAAMPLVLTLDGTVVALATVTFPADPDSGGTAQDREQTLHLERLVTDPAVSMPEAASLSWIITTRIRDVAARAGYGWVRMQVGPARLAAHLQTRLAWRLDATVHRDGVPVHLLRQRAERSDAVRALVPAPATTRGPLAGDKLRYARLLGLPNAAVLSPDHPDTGIEVIARTSGRTTRTDLSHIPDTNPFTPT